MNRHKHIEATVEKIIATLGCEASAAEKQAIEKIVEDLVVQAIDLSSEHYHSKVVMCCGPEADLAHKIAHEVKQSQAALIANLMSLR